MFAFFQIIQDFKISGSHPQHGRHPPERVQQGDLHPEGPRECVQDKAASQSFYIVCWLNSVHCNRSLGMQYTHFKNKYLLIIWCQIFQLLELPAEVDRLETNQALLVTKRVLFIKTVLNETNIAQDDYTEVQCLHLFALF